MPTDFFRNLGAWVIQVVSSLGYPGVAALVALENLFPPIPSEVVLPLAGYLAGQGQLSFWLVVATATLGSVAGAVLLYFMGRKLGAERLRDLADRYGHWLLLRGSDLDRGQDWFKRHGDKAVLLGRLVPTVRSLISIPAGVAGMPFWRFLLFSTLGSAAWNTLLVGLGFMLGERWSEVEQFADVLGLGVTAACVLGVAWFVWRRVASPAARPRG